MRNLILTAACLALLALLAPSAARAQDAQQLADKGALHFGNREFERALAAFSQAVELQPKNALFRLKRGICLFALEKFAPAIEDFTEALKARPDDPLPWLHRAHCHLRLRDFDKAIADCTRALELDPKQAHAYLLRGNALAAKSNSDLAEANRLDPLLARQVLLPANPSPLARLPEQVRPGDSSQRGPGNPRQTGSQR